MKKIYLFGALLLSVILNGCVSTYFPNEIQTPSVKKGEVEASLSTGSNLVSLSAAASPIDHLVITLNGGYVYNFTNSDPLQGTLAEREQLLLDVGVGGYLETPDGHARVTLVGGYAWGSSELSEDVNEMPVVDNMDIRTRFERPYGLLILQGATTPSPKGVQFTGGFAVRAGWFGFRQYDVFSQGVLEDGDIPAARWKYDPAIFSKLSFRLNEKLTLQVKGQCGLSFTRFPVEEYAYRPYLLFGGLGLLW